MPKGGSSSWDYVREPTDYEKRNSKSNHFVSSGYTSKKKEPEVKAPSPSDILADITNDQFQQYEEDFKPVEEALIEEVEDNTAELAASEQAKKDSRAAFDRGMKRNERRIKRTGITMSAGQAANLDKQMGLAGGRTVTGAANLAYRGQEQEDAATTTDLVLAGQGLRGTALSALGNAATMESQREQAGLALQAQHTQNTLGSIGSGAALGFQMYGPVGGAVGAGIGLLTSFF
jgi:hypothetical protein